MRIAKNLGWWVLLRRFMMLDREEKSAGGVPKPKGEAWNTCAEIQSLSLTELVQDFLEQLLSQNADT